jgi:hypothetical protein
VIILKAIKNHVVIFGFVLQLILTILFFNPIFDKIPDYMPIYIYVFVLGTSSISAIYSICRGKHVGLSVAVIIITILLASIFTLCWLVSLM